MSDFKYGWAIFNRPLSLNGRFKIVPPCLIPPSRVVGEDFVAEDGAVEVEVDFGGLDAFVAEHLLDGAQIGAAFEQVSRK